MLGGQVSARSFANNTSEIWHDAMRGVVVQQLPVGAVEADEDDRTRGVCQPSDLRNGSSTLPTWRQIESRRHTARRQVSRLQIALKRADEGVARCAWVREDIFSDAFYCDAPHALRKRIAPRAGGPIVGEPRRRLICERDLHIHRISGNGSIEEKAIAKEWDDAVAPRAEDPGCIERPGAHQIAAR